MSDSTNLEDVEAIPFHSKILTEKTGVILCFVSLGVLLAGVFIFIICGSWHKSDVLDEAKVAQFGDFIGGIVGTLVALVGIILYYVALTEQRKDIKINQTALGLQITALNHQVEEFKAQKEELISTRKIYEQQTKTMRNQQFDSNFYSILNVYLAIKNNLNENAANHDFFSEVYSEIIDQITIGDNDSFYETNKKAIENYTNIYLKYRGKLSSYFKTIYRLLKFVDECDHLKEEEKLFYSKIIRSQISDNELLILYYNYHSIFGKKAQQLSLKYSTLKHIQRLSKIEFVKHFIFADENVKIKLILFTEWLIELVHNNINTAKDIENVTPIKISEIYADYGFIVAIDIDISFELKVIIKNELIANLPFTEEIFSNFINLVLYDYYSLEKFNPVDPDIITKSIIKEKDNIVLKYTIENL